jgi:hypothetical protein
MAVSVRTVHLTCSEFYVDARLTAVDGRWLASADTPDGPSIGTGDTAGHGAIGEGQDSDRRPVWRLGKRLTVTPKRGAGA